MTGLQQESVTQEVSLLKELTAAYQKSIAIKFSISEMGLLDALNSMDFNISSKAGIQLDQLGRKLNELVTKDDRFPGNCVRLVRHAGGGFYPYFIGPILVRRALETHSPEEGIEWLQKVMTTTTANGKSIHALWGAPVEQEILLSA